MTVVVDASAWYLCAVEPKTDPRAELAQEILPRLEAQSELVAPAMLGYELVHLVHVKHRATGGDLEMRRERLRRLLSPIRFEPSEWADVGAVAESQGISGYDAAYVELARRLDGILLTEDSKMHAAGVKVLGKKRVWSLAEASQTLAT